MSPPSRRSTSSWTVADACQHRIHKAESILREHADKLPSDWHEQLAEQLLADEDFKIVEKVIGSLRADIPTAGPSDQFDVSSLQILSDADAAVQDLLRICITFQEIPASEALTRCSERYYAILAEKWEAVIRWMMFLAKCASLNTLPAEVLSSHARLLKTIATGMDSNPYREDIICRPHTIDFVHFLLCNINPENGSRYVLPLFDANEPCIILQLVHLCMYSHASGTAFISRFLSYGKSSQHAIIQSLVSRPEEVTSSACNVTGAVKNLALIFAVFFQLVFERDLRLARQHQNVVYRYASALSICAEKAHEHDIKDTNFWTIVAQCIGLLTDGAILPLGQSAILQLVQGGILACAARCSPHLARGGSQSRLLSLAPYLYPSKVVKKAMERRELELWACSIPENATSLHAEVHIVYRSILYRAFQAQQYREYIPICSNLKHASNPDKDKTLTVSDMRSCSRCHTMAYCSSRCQEQDWAEFHSRECSAFAKTYQKHRSANSWPSLSRRFDALRMLERFANETYPPPTELSKIEHTVIDYSRLGPPRPPLLRYKAASALEMLDYHVSQNDKAMIYQRMGLVSYFNTHAWWITEAFEPWIPRYQRLIDDMEENKDTIVLADARFRINQHHVLVVFASLRYSADAEEGHKYTVLNSTFNTVID